MSGISVRVDNSRIALILVEAFFYGDKKAAKRWGITTRTIRNYWQQFDSDKELSACFHDERLKFESNWAQKIPGAIISGIEFIAEATREADYKDPNVIVAITNAVKTLSEIGLTKELIDARLSRENREEGQSVFPAIASEVGEDTGDLA